MKRTLFTIVLCLILSVSTLAQSIAPVPPLMNFQGRLAKPDGSPVPDGTYALRFSFWSQQSGGTSTFCLA